MAYKSILTVLTNPDTVELAITSAARLALALDRAVDLAMMGSPSLQPPLAGALP